jgi:hypothetical protein
MHIGGVSCDKGNRSELEFLSSEFSNVSILIIVMIQFDKTFDLFLKHEFIF